MAKKNDNELEEYLFNIMAYSREIVEAAIFELKNRGRVFTDCELSTIESKIQKRENSIGKNTIVVSDRLEKKIEFSENEKNYLKKHSVNLLRITSKKQLKSLFYFLLATFMTIVFYYVMEIDTLFLMMILLPLYTFTVLPTLFLHFEYIHKNKDEEYELCGDKIIKRKGSEEFVYKKEDISSIEIYMSPNYFNSERYYTTFANYHFAKVLLDSGEKIYITSLLDPNGIDKVFSLYLDSISYRRIKRIFATTLY